MQKLGTGLVVALLLNVAPSGSDQTGALAPQGEAQTARLSPEVRLRKLHLVRPDLIPYPIAMDIYC